MVMQRTRPQLGSAFAEGAYMAPTAQPGAGQFSAGGSYGVSGSGTAMVMGIALAGVVIFYLATRGIQGSR